MNNNLIERLNGTYRARDKTLRGMHSMSSAQHYLDGLTIQYNYFRDHEALNGRKPADAAKVDVPYKEWADFVRADIAVPPGWKKPVVKRGDGTDTACQCPAGQRNCRQETCQAVWHHRGQGQSQGTEEGQGTRAEGHTAGSWGWPQCSQRHGRRALPTVWGQDDAGSAAQAASGQWLAALNRGRTNSTAEGCPGGTVFWVTQAATIKPWRRISTAVPQ